MLKQETPVISAIAAMAENRVIGINNKLPWHLPADLKHFKQLTTGNPILMGRKTYESIGRPLPNRLNIVLTREPQFQAPGCEVVNSIEAAMRLAAQDNKSEIFIIGGAEIYHQLLPKIQRIYLTIVHHDFDGDAYFPALSSTDWIEVAREKHCADAENMYEYSFITLERKHCSNT